MNFSENESEVLNKIIISRRDIRGNNFLKKKVRKKDIKKILQAGLDAPSVGFSQPWKFVVIQDDKIKNSIYKNFKKSYKKSKKHFKDRPIYNSLKLEGIKEAPLNIAVFYQKPKQKILGQTAQKEMGEYSVVCAVQNMWLMARSLNIGMGWVSILNPKKVHETLDINDEYKLISYLCVGYPKKFLDTPELQTLKWEKKKNLNESVSWV